MTLPLSFDLLFGQWDKTPYMMLVVNSCVLAILAIITFAKSKVLTNKGKFIWYYYIVFGILVYSITNGITFGFGSVMRAFSFPLQALLVTIQNILFMIGVICYRRP